MNHFHIYKNLLASAHERASNSLLIAALRRTHTVSTQLCSAPSSSWTGLKGFIIRPNYYLTSHSPADPAPPPFLWAHLDPRSNTPTLLAVRLSANDISPALPPPS